MTTRTTQSSPFSFASPVTAGVVGASLALGLLMPLHSGAESAPASSTAPTVVEWQPTATQVRYRKIEIDGTNIAYREAGDPSKPTVLLLHGFPTSSHMFRNLIPALSERYHVLAPDYPGYGASDMPSHTEFDYSFAHLASLIARFIDAKGVDEYALYLMDYGAPIGYRVFAAAPERVTGFIIQNGNAYEEGLEEFWDPIRALWREDTAEHRDALRNFLTLEGTRWQYTHGVPDESLVSPDTWQHDQYLLDRPGNQEIQLALFKSYATNVDLYPTWQALFREHQPPALIVWGKNDFIFPASGAFTYQRDLKDVELHLLDTGHFALEVFGDFIAAEMLDFLDEKVADRSKAATH
ncbi:MAG: alpha/beta fold hydrolase [Pseudomonadota bacterium]